MPRSLRASSFVTQRRPICLARRGGSYRRSTLSALNDCCRLSRRICQSLRSSLVFRNLNQGLSWVATPEYGRGKSGANVQTRSYETVSRTYGRGVCGTLGESCCHQQVRHEHSVCQECEAGRFLDDRHRCLDGRDFTGSTPRLTQEQTYPILRFYAMLFPLEGFGHPLRPAYTQRKSGLVSALKTLGCGTTIERIFYLRHLTAGLSNWRTDW
jgi:hypothetical protein